jgi:cell division septation protein DedD
LQEQLKERLTGAAILVVIVVFAVPEMFHGRPQPLHGAAAAVDAAIPLRTYTIDLRETPAAQATPPAPAGAADAAAPTDGAALVPAPAVPEPAVPEPAMAEPAAASPAGVAKGVIQRADPQPAPPDPKPVAEEPRPVAAQPRAAPRAAPAAAAAPEGGWAVQVGSFSRKELAERMTRQVRAKGFPVQMVGPDARGLYRVRSTLLPERAAALALREKMVEKGYKPIVNASP